MHKINSQKRKFFSSLLILTYAIRVLMYFKGEAQIFGHSKVRVPQSLDFN